MVIGVPSGTSAGCGLFLVGMRWRGRVRFYDGAVGWVRCSVASSMRLLAYGGLLSEE